MRTVFFNGVELTEPEAIEAALRHKYSTDLTGRPASLAEMRGEPEPDPIRNAIDRAAARWALDQAGGAS